MITRRPMLLQQAVIGWKEHVRFPKLKLGPLVAKIDTGARSAALHADHIDVNGRRVRFAIASDGAHKRYAAPLVGFKRIKSSNGQSEMRPVVRVTIELGATLIKAEITLTDRSDMGVPMLLGRSVIKGKFLVNPAKSFLLSRKARGST